MNLTKGLRATRRTAVCGLALSLLMAFAIVMTIAVRAQGVSTTTVQGTVYLADGHPGSGTLMVRWPAFSTSTGQAVAAGSMTVKIPADGFVSVNLAPNLGSTPAGQFYTVVLYLSDGSTSTEYWVVPAAATVTLAQVRAQVMPAAQAVQAVSKTYVDQTVSQLMQSLLTASGGNLSGPLYLNGDPTQALQAADKHYVDTQVATVLPVSGGTLTGPLILSGDPAQDLQAADKRYVDTTSSTAASVAIANAWPGVTVSSNGDAQFNGSLKVGSSNSLYASFTGRTSIAFPGLATTSGRNCLQIDDSGNITNTGSACSSGSGTVNAGTFGQVAYYTGNGTAIAGLSAVPVTAGGTGASSAAAALANLGALPKTGGTLSGSLGGTDASFTGTVAASTSFSGPATGLTGTASNLTAGAATHAQNLPTDFASQSAATPSTGKFTSVAGNVNGVFSVATYGAVGNCIAQGSTTSCTDNTAAIQAAIDAAYSVKGSVYFPTDPSHSGQTVYYVANAVNSKGVSMYGPPGGSGPANFYTSTNPVAVRGGVGKDVFDVVDPTSGSYVSPLASFTVKDLTILVDDTTDASASFPYRKLGRLCADLVTTSGSPIITSATQCEFQPGDIGQSILVGAQTTSILSWQSANQVTLAVNASGSASGVSTYISVMSLPVTATIGNCGFAYDDKSGAGQIILKATFSNVVVNAIDNNARNNMCGFFFQGNAFHYQSRWEHSYVEGDFAFAFVPASAVAPSPSIMAGLGDFNTWDHVWIAGRYPFLEYSGSFGAFRDVQVSRSVFGPHIMSAYGEQTDSHNWYIDIPENENPAQVCGTNDISFRITGRDHVVDRLAVPYCPTYAQTVQWDASNSVVHSFSPNTTGAVNVTGDLNSFFVPNTTNGAHWVITGNGNTVRTARSSNPYNGVPIARTQYIGGANSTFGSPQGSRGATVFERNHDFINSGASAYYFNGEDLWLWPNELFDGSGAMNVVDSPTSDTSKAILNAGGSSQRNPFGANGTAWIIGKQIPASKVRIYYEQYATVNNGWMSVGASYGTSPGAGGNALAGCNWQLPTSYTVKYCDQDLTGLEGKYLVLRIGGFGFPVAGTDVYTGWFAIKPWTSDMDATSITLGSGTAMTGNHGTGTSVQHSDGTGISQAAFFDVNGNLTATAAALPSGTTATTQTAGDNSIKVATTAYVAAPGAIAPTTVTASGIISGGNDATRTTSTTITNAWTTTGLVLPSVPVNTTKSGHCTIFWQMSSTSYTATFGLGMNNAPTNVWGGTRVIYAAAGTSNWLAFTQSSTATTAVSAATTAGVTGTTYEAMMDFVVQTGASNPVALTVYGQTSNSGATLTIMPGSTCYWLP